MRTQRIKGSRLSVLLIAVGLALIALAAVKLYAVPDLIQYVVLAPNAAADQMQDSGDSADGEAEAAVKTVLQMELESFSNLKEDLAVVASHIDLSGMQPNTSVATEAGDQKSGLLNAVGESFFALYHCPIVEGRQFYQEELKYGDRVAVLNEKLAFELFRSSSPLDRLVEINGEKYRVVGVVRDERQVGDVDECTVFVPIVQIAEKSFQLTTMTVSVRPIPGMGAINAVPDIVKGWKSEGNLYSMRKEAMYGLLLARVLGFFIAMGLVLKLIRALVRWLGREISEYIARLKREYARDMIWLLLLKLLGGLAAGAALAGAVFGLIAFVIDPVYTFTEWIPSVLVDPKEIIEKFWTVQVASSSAVELRTPQLLRMRFFGTVAVVGVVITLLGVMGRAYGKRRVVVEDEGEEEG